MQSTLDISENTYIEFRTNPFVPPFGPHLCNYLPDVISSDVMSKTLNTSDWRWQNFPGNYVAQKILTYDTPLAESACAFEDT